MDESVRRKTKRERFLVVAQRRTERILHDLRLLANCGNRGAYEYTDADVAKIFDAIEREMQRARGRFAGRREEFRL